ncbi:MAG: hypothetical protein IE909_13255 [Campylobacterales bacterium]|nr:hypothetical protein [Campylobacterales bacterium]
MRVKEQLQKEQEKEEILDWSFAEWLDHFSKESTSKELEDMEKQINKSHKFYPLNNPHYFPLQGA